MNSDGCHLGIDLGTANTCTSIFHNGKAEIIPHDDDPLMPSCVAFTEDGRLIGSAAKQQASRNPSNTIFNVLSYIGFKYTDERIQRLIKQSPYRIVQQSSKPAFVVQYRGRDRTLTPEAILSMLFCRIKKDTYAHLGKVKITGAVITLPSHFKIHQRQAVEDAAFIAGLPLMMFIEPATAACVDYALTRARRLRPSQSETILVVDYGATSVDMVLASLEDGILDVHAVVSNDEGGNDLDTRLIDHLTNEFKRKRGLDLTTNHRANRRLRTAVESAKRELSSCEQASIELEQLFEGQDLFTGITRKQFEKLCVDKLSSFCHPIERILWFAKKEKASIDCALFVGGSSRIPYAQTKMSEFLGKKDLSAGLIIDETSARGAAIIAALRSGDESKPLKEFLLLEVMPNSIGMETDGGIMETIVKRNSTIPLGKSRKFETSADNETSFLVSLYEGERIRVKDNTPLLEFELPISPAPRGAVQVEVNIGVRLDGVYIEAKEQLSEEQMKKGATPNVMKLKLRGQNIFSEEELDRMLAEEKEFSKHERSELQRTAMRGALEEQLYALKTYISEISPDIQNWTVDRTLRLADWLLTWLDDNQKAPMEEYSARLSEVQSAKTALEQDTLKRKTSTVPQHVPKYTTTLDRSLDDDYTLVSTDSDLHDHNESPREAPEVKDRSHVEAESTNSAQNDSNDGVSFTKETPDEIQIEDASEAQENEVESNLVTVRPPPSPSPYQARVSDDETSDSIRPITHDQRRMTDPVSSSATKPRLPTTVPPSPSEVSTPSQSSQFDRPPPIERGMTELFSKSRDEKLVYTDADFVRISSFLENTGSVPWSRVPRLYTVLRLIDQLEMLDSFIQQGITDMYIPFAAENLPIKLSVSAREDFIKHQNVVISKALLFEQSQERKHARFAHGEPLPFRVVAKLGSGAHGHVDKVMSTISDREFARKLFRRVRGISRDAISSFFLELQVLKKMEHRHCVQLVLSYTDPRYFALLMSPVGDCNLFDYYDFALASQDKASLLRSFFGCLANALEYIHNTKIRHRDIKPHNILVKGDQVFFTDFGIALDWENLSRATTTADSAKTWLYAAPEVVRYERRNTSADVWSLGCVFMEMITVLKGQSITSLRNFLQEDSGNYRFYANLPRLFEWTKILQKQGFQKDDVAIDWVLSMLQENGDDRPTATELHSEISTVCSRDHVPFCGSCCLEEMDLSMDEDEEEDELWDLAADLAVA